MTTAQPTEPLTVTFTCAGHAVGKMRNELDIAMTEPMTERFSMATDEGPFHGGDATAPPPLAHFVAGLTGCIMTQIRAFAKRMDVVIDDLHVNAEVRWQWTPMGRIYETAPKSFHIDVLIDSSAAFEDQVALVQAAKKGCFVEQTLGQANVVKHRIRSAHGFVTID
mgnify:CR=1 FL=1